MTKVPLTAVAALVISLLTIAGVRAETGLIPQDARLWVSHGVPNNLVGSSNFGSRSVFSAAALGAQAQAPQPDPNGLVQRVCTACHNPYTLEGNLSLEEFDVTAAEENTEVAEKMIRKLRAGMMPPPGVRRPPAEEVLTLVNTLETRIDAAAARNPNPGGRAFQRLNRPEYERAVQDLLGLDVNAGDWLPLDQMSANFDNMADAQTLSPTLLEGYLNAASEISRMAVGNQNVPAQDETYSNSPYISQHPWDRIEGAPYGTRGGIVVDHVFPADGDYVFELSTFTSAAGAMLEDIDISINRERIALLLLNTDRGDAGADGRGGTPVRSAPIFVRAGQQQVAAAFVRLAEGPYEDLIRPHDWSFAGGGAGGEGVTGLPHLQDLIIRGPYNTTGVSDTLTRQRIFSCRPTMPTEERPCARAIMVRLSGEAYRRQLTAAEVDDLMSFYDTGAAKGGFEIGVRTALEAILASPHFVLRLETEPVDIRPGEGYRITDLDLASRLSFFLWGASPDEELQTVATEGRLSDPAELDRQTRRMLADPRAEALATRFAAQWFRLQDMDTVHPDPNYYPNFDESLAGAMRRETELFFDFLVREDRSLFELYTADYTFVNERLARHYGFSNVAGRHFRRVTYPDDRRRGLLGHGSILVLTSMANRTSPVLRGKWVMEVLLGTPPPPPPPDVPTLEETEGAKDGRLLTTRERMEIHRTNPVCRSCHRFMDPIGLALDNFDVTANWRVRENGMPLDTRGDFYDGTKVSTLGELSDVLLKRPIPLVRTFTENLLAYSLGRRVETYDQPTIRAIARAAESDEYRMSSFILGVVKSDAFQMKRVAPVVDENTAANNPQ